MDVDTIRRRLVIRGRVQGVGFRVSCREQAEWHGVSGSVHNLSDGAVEIVAEGEAEAVDPFVKWCHHGPRHAQVTDVALTNEEPWGETGFRIAR